MLDSTRGWTIGSAGVSLAVGAGTAAGLGLEWRGCSGLITVTTLAGFLLALGAVIGPPRFGGREIAQRIGAAALTGYIVTVVAVEPIAYVHGLPGVVAAAGWLWPLVPGGVLMTRFGNVLAGAGACSVLLGGCAAASFNLSHVGHGVGFAGYWIS